MKAQEPFKIEFHSGAAARFNQLAEEALKNVRSFGRIRPSPPPTRQAEIHPVFNVTAEHIIGKVKVLDRSVNLLGEETGHFWNSNGFRVGWDGVEFEAIKRLTREFENSNPVKGRVSHKFLLDEICKWLQEKL